MKKVLVSMAMIALLTACATSGTKFEMSTVNAMQPSITTYEEAVAKLGDPRVVTISTDGAKSVVWSWAHVGGFTGVQSRAVKILFDRDGKMIRVAGKAGDQIE